MTAEEIKELDAKMRRAIGTYDTGLVINIAESVTKVAVEFAESLAKERSDEFDVWKSKLSPSQKCTVHPPAGSGGSHGIYELTNDQLYDTFLAEKRKEGAE